MIQAHTYITIIACHRVLWLIYVYAIRVVREGVSVVLIHYLAFGYHLSHGLSW